MGSGSIPNANFFNRASFSQSESNSEKIRFANGVPATSARSSARPERLRSSAHRPLPLAPQGIVCSYAPSQSHIVAALSSAAGGSAAAVLAIAQATGLSVVVHSRGAYILTGSAGYVAGTLGAAIAAPAILTVGVLVAGSAVTVKLVCAPQNHPREVAKVMLAAQEFARKSKTAFAQVKARVEPHVVLANVKIKELTGNVFDYANHN